MKFKIVIEQNGKFGKETINGTTESYQDAVSLVNLILAACEDTQVTLTAVISNKNKIESEEE